MVTTDGLHRVTGTLDPDATGDYLPGGTHNGKTYYVRDDGVYKIWWQIPVAWIISLDLDTVLPGFWTRVDPSIEGDYIPQAPWTGTPTVTEI